MSTTPASQERQYWESDKLKRAEQSKLIIDFLEGRLAHRAGKNAVRSYVLNIDSPWGHGKTYFLNGVKLDLEARGHVVAYVNAWESDFGDQPLLAVLSSVEAALKPFFKSRDALKRAWETLVTAGGGLAGSLVKSVGAKIVERYVGEEFGEQVADTFDLTAPADPSGIEAAVEEIIDKVSDRALEALLKEFRKGAASIETFKANAAALVKTLPQEPSERFLFVLVDELDRCRPSYAIRLLEDAKHLFAVDGVVFVIATDTEQLTESIRGTYGPSFDSSRYLHRFFDRTYRFPEPDTADFVEFIFARDEIDTTKLRVGSRIELAPGCAAYFKALGAGLRDIEQCMDILSTFVALWPHKVPIELAYLLPLIFFYQQSDLKRFDQYSSAKALDSKDLMPSERLWVETTAGGYDSPPREVLITTEMLTAAFRSKLDMRIQKVHEIRDVRGAEAYVRDAISNEFAVLHNYQYSQTAPKFTVLNEYKKYIQLSHRFERESAA